MLRRLLNQAVDESHGGWFEFLAPETEDQRKKTAYVHAFVLLAATSARLAQRNSADELLSRVTDTNRRALLGRESRSVCRRMEF